MATATAIAGGAGAVGGLLKTFEGRRMQREAQAKIDAFEWQEINNPYDNLQVSTMGADLRREQADLNTATAMDTIRSGGTRSIVGATGRLVAQNNNINREIAADLDQQQKNIDYAGAQYDTKITDMVENRQANELAGYGQMMNVGMGMKYQGIGNMVNAVGAMGQAGQGMMQNSANNQLTNQYQNMTQG